MTRQSIVFSVVLSSRMLFYSAGKQFFPQSVADLDESNETGGGIWWLNAAVKLLRNGWVSGSGYLTVFLMPRQMFRTVLTANKKFDYTHTFLHINISYCRVFALSCLRKGRPFDLSGRCVCSRHAQYFILPRTLFGVVTCKSPRSKTFLNDQVFVKQVAPEWCIANETVND